MTTLQWCLVAIASVIAGMVVSRMIKPGAQPPQPPKPKRKNDD